MHKMLKQTAYKMQIQTKKYEKLRKYEYRKTSSHKTFLIKNYWNANLKFSEFKKATSGTT